jgi:hypothetical protein
MELLYLAIFYILSIGVAYYFISLRVNRLLNDIYDKLELMRKDNVSFQRRVSKVIRGVEQD